MSGGAGSAAAEPINRECSNEAPAAAAEEAAVGPPMTLPGDGLRRRKVIHAAKETLDKGESAYRPLSLSLSLSRRRVFVPRFFGR